MIEDMTYQELSNIKSNIKDFLDEIEKIAEKNKFDFSECDKCFFLFIAKHIVFLKYIYNDDQKSYFYKVLISDFYYFILSIVKSEKRYIYVNERSIIENYVRAIMQVSIESNYITKTVLEQLHHTDFKCEFTEKEYYLIIDEYSVACDYVHGGNILKNDLASVLSECDNSRIEYKKRNKLYGKWKNLIKIFDNLLIAQYPEFISGCFHRKKSIMSYLVGCSEVKLLFNILSIK